MTKLQPYRHCHECGTAFRPLALRMADFCSTDCRKTFGNRRMKRGAELYDVLMAWRHDRKAAAAGKLWTLACRMLRQWRDEDKEQRAGRRSYADPARGPEKYQRYRLYRATRLTGTAPSGPPA